MAFVWSVCAMLVKLTCSHVLSFYTSVFRVFVPHGGYLEQRGAQAVQLVLERLCDELSRLSTQDAEDSVNNAGIHDSGKKESIVPRIKAVSRALALHQGVNGDSNPEQNAAVSGAEEIPDLFERLSHAQSELERQMEVVQSLFHEIHERCSYQLKEFTQTFSRRMAKSRQVLQAIEPVQALNRLPIDNSHTDSFEVPPRPMSAQPLRKTSPSSPADSSASIPVQYQRHGRITRRNSEHIARGSVSSLSDCTEDVKASSHGLKATINRDSAEQPDYDQDVPLQQQRRRSTSKVALGRYPTAPAAIRPTSATTAATAAAASTTAQVQQPQPRRAVSRVPSLLTRGRGRMQIPMFGERL